MTKFTPSQVSRPKLKRLKRERVALTNPILNKKARFRRHCDGPQYELRFHPERPIGFEAVLRLKFRLGRFVTFLELGGFWQMEAILPKLSEARFASLPPAIGAALIEVAWEGLLERLEGWSGQNISLDQVWVKPGPAQASAVFKFPNYERLPFSLSCREGRNLKGALLFEPAFFCSRPIA